MRRNVATILFLLVSFFIYVAVICLRENSSLPSHIEQVKPELDLNLSYFHQVSLQKYRLPSFYSPISIVAVPSCHDAHAHYLTSAVYQSISKHLVDHVILILQSEDHVFHGVALPTHRAVEKIFIHNTLHTDSIEQLSEHVLFHYYDAVYHAPKNLELQLAYMRYYFDAKTLITPVIMGQVTDENLVEIADQLAQIANEKTLIVVAVNIKSNQNVAAQSAFHQQSQLEMYASDTSVIQAIQGVPAGNNDISTGCLYGKYGYILLLKLLQLEKYSNVNSHFVGYDQSEQRQLQQSYAAFVYEQNKAKGYKNYIGYYEQQQLIGIAYDALHELFEPCKVKKSHMISYEMTQPHGAFVSLYAMSDHGTLLRGCMGVMTCQEPLSEIIAEMAKQAATLDHRFYVLKYQELKSTMVSISLVTNLTQVTDFSTIHQSDGIIFEYGDCSAVTFGSKDFHDTWSYQHVLTDLCFQSSVAAQSWQQPDAKIFTFNSIDFQ
ncbi:AmmeMemoRadiSam system protein B [Candidatus Chromulinivorax destructor]|uniref:AmmeMemoRadiSam system protein B n=1 Tax=Candidatus Chromulinivorax destructor TaxID=2066483 RepID=A0A345ZAF0_9BACT|nr:AmmeMemoRadiSam system protein B [Candidatus Chromulinivorax destructor]AXK60267.1 AmmeMemoRadiSam system protein B [Candidatus Chromulinivorax destructor]